MKKFIFAFLTLFLVSAQPCFAEQFVDGMEDVPLMQGLDEVDNSDIAFGNEESRYLEVSLKAKNNNTSFDKVEKFYKNTLPQLGWTFKGKKSDVLFFYRDGEVIEIAKEKTQPLQVRITLRSEN